MANILCKLRHKWEWMTWQMAYPAPKGKICKRCGATRLYWFSGSHQ